MFDYHFPDKMNTKSVFVFETVSGKSIWIKFMVILQREQKESNIDERLASARKRLHENYQEAQNGFYFWKFPVEKYFVKRVHHMVYWRGVTDTIHARPMWPNMNELTTPRRHGDGAVWGCIVPSWAVCSAI